MHIEEERVGGIGSVHEPAKFLQELKRRYSVGNRRAVLGVAPQGSSSEPMQSTSAAAGQCNCKEVQIQDKASTTMHTLLPHAAPKAQFGSQGGSCLLLHMEHINARKQHSN